jgi:hypothetical protein
MDEFRITILGNVDECRTEAEVYLLPDSDGPVAVVYESGNGWRVDPLEGAVALPLDVLVTALAAARKRLERYVNRRGDNRPAGLTRPGLSLWLMEQGDGISMGKWIR